jgi:hypothetical protein
MRIALLALLVGVVLLSIGVSLLFGIKFVAIVAALMVFFKGFKFTFLIQWFMRFLLIRVPQRILTTWVKLYFIDRATLEKAKRWLNRQQLYWRTHHKTRLLIFGALALILMGASAWAIGLWLLLIYEVEVLALMMWRRIWPTLSETAVVQALNKALGLLAKTKIGRVYTAADAWLEERLRRTAETTGATHKRKVVLAVEQVLTGILERMPPVPPQKQSGHRHLLPRNPRSARRADAKSPHRQSPQPPPRPKR